MATGDFAASVSASSSTAESSSPTGTTLLTRPSRSASAASRRRPVAMSSSAMRGDSTRKIGTVIMNGQSPTLISGVPKTASSAATTRSHAIANPKPPARAKPQTRAIVGLPRLHRSRKSRASSPRPSWAAIAPVLSANDPRSAPAQNAWSPAPVRITTRTPSSDFAAATASRSCRMTSADIALRRSGRLIVTRAA